MFSVIVPTRNRPETLARTLRAIARQTATNMEAIVLDDGSTAQARAAARALIETLGRRFRLVELGAPGDAGSGPARARNRGLAEARGDFLTFCDDDDEWRAPDHLAVAGEALRAHPDAALYIANQAAVRGGRIERGNWLPALTAAAHNVPAVLPQDTLIESPSWPHLNVLIVKRELAMAAGGFWEEIRFEEDLDFYWRCLDRVSYALFRPQVVAWHHIPDPARAATVSLALQEVERLQMRLRMAVHVQQAVSTPALAARARGLQAETLRSIGLSLARQGQSAEALPYARQGLRLRFTWKWLLYVAWLSLRAALGH